MALIGRGRIAPLGGAKEIVLGSATDTLEITDQDGFPIFKVDANGNLYLKGGVKKI